jgi:hypothetical protein
MLVLLALVILPGLSFGQKDQISLGDATVAEAPSFTYEIVDVHFDEPRNFSRGAASVRVSRISKVVVKGEGFRAKATGPIVWLNGVATMRTQVSEDGRTVEAYFFESVSDIESAAKRLRGWQLIYQPHEGCDEVYRISPTGVPADAQNRPRVSRANQ